MSYIRRNITMENINDKEPMTIYYQIDRTRSQVSDDEYRTHYCIIKLNQSKIV